MITEGCNLREKSQKTYCDKISREYDDEFIVHMFLSSGEEISLPDLDSFTGAQIGDYQNIETTKAYKVLFADSTEEYILFLTKNTGKESQIAEALQKSLPILGIVVLVVSVIAAFFYSRYMTAPIKKVSRLSKQMADMDFNGLCSTTRTDEIGVLSVSLNTLSQKLGAALSDLQKANQKLQSDIDMERQLERQRVEFFSAASHELKTPITIIKGQLQGMLYQVGRYKDREPYLAQSLEVTDNLEKMVQELLTISRLDTTGYAFNPSHIHLDKLIYDRLTVHEDLFMQRELSVEKDISPEVCISGDLQLLQKVVDNLLGNAAAYSPAGERITVKVWQADEKAHLTIENTGVHIPDKDIPKLFEAFYRVDQSRNRQTGGTGLGLYIVKTILDLHGAAIKIENTTQGVKVSVQF
nr:HAMP domain-containing sensor histidine kinase [uncultured Oscillibacter sp.]